MNARRNASTRIRNFVNNNYIYCMTSLHEIKSKLKSHKDILSKKYGFVTMAVFGSYSREQQAEDSDVDILVEFYKPIGIELWILQRN